MTVTGTAMSMCDDGFTHKFQLQIWGVSITASVIIYTGICYCYKPE